MWDMNQNGIQIKKKRQNSTAEVQQRFWKGTKWESIDNDGARPHPLQATVAHRRSLERNNDCVSDWVEWREKWKSDGETREENGEGDRVGKRNKEREREWWKWMRWENRCRWEIQCMCINGNGNTLDGVSNPNRHTLGGE